MLGIDLKHFMPHLDRCVAALESMADSFAVMAETARKQGELLDRAAASGYVVQDDPAMGSVAAPRSLHAVKGGERRGSAR